MQKQISTTKGIIIIVGAAILAIAGVSVYQYFKVKNEYATPKQIQNSNNETADWKTYKNDVYGFEIQYPQEWWKEEQINVVEFSGPSSGSSQFALRISTESNPEKLSSKEFVLKNLKEPEMGSNYQEFTSEEAEFFKNGKEVELGGLSAFQLKEGREGTYEEIFLTRNSSTIEFFYPTEKNIGGLKNPEMINKVISTFKFTK